MTYMMALILCFEKTLHTLCFRLLYVIFKELYVLEIKTHIQTKKLYDSMLRIKIYNIRI